MLGALAGCISHFRYSRSTCSTPQTLRVVISICTSSIAIIRCRRSVHTHSHSLDRSCSCVFLPSRTLVCRLLKLLVSKCHHARSSLSPSAHVVSSQTANRRSSLDRSFNTTFLIGLDYISLCIRTGVHEEVVNSLNIPSRVHRKQVDYNNTRHVFQESI